MGGELRPGKQHDPNQQLQRRTQVSQYLPTPEQQQVCLAELQQQAGSSSQAGMSSQQQQQQYGGSNKKGEGGVVLLTQTPEVPATVRRPVAKDLEERGLPKPGVARASVAPSLEVPDGLTEGPHLRLGKHRTVMQQHVDFWDRDGDGIITMWDTYAGFRRLGFNVPFSLWAVLVINPAFSLVSSPGWLPDPLMRVFTDNIHRGKHGSDQEVYDHEGRFIPQRFEDVWSKWDRSGGRDRLSARDIWEMTQGTFEVNDFFGWFAGKFEWYTSWLLAADQDGMLRKEAVRGIYDGSLFYLLEAKFTHHRPLPPGMEPSLGDGSSPSAIWNRWRRGTTTTTTTTKQQHGGATGGQYDTTKIKGQ